MNNITGLIDFSNFLINFSAISLVLMIFGVSFILYFIGKAMYVLIGMDSNISDEINIDDFDIHSLDSTLAKIIRPCLIKFKDTTNSWPPEFEEIEEWDAILDKMIYSFGCYEHENFMEYMKTPEFKEGIELFGKYYIHLWT